MIIVKILLSIISILLAAVAAFLAAGIIRTLPTLSRLLGNEHGDIEKISRELSDLNIKDPSFRKKIRDSLLNVVGIFQRTGIDMKDENKNMSTLAKWGFILITISAVIQIIILLL